MFKRLALDIPGTDSLIQKDEEPAYDATASIKEDLDGNVTSARYLTEAELRAKSDAYCAEHGYANAKEALEAHYVKQEAYLAMGDFHTVPDQLPPSSQRKMRTGPSDPDVDSDPDLSAV